MKPTHIHNYVFLPCIAGEHRYCRAEYKTQYNTALGEVEAGHCICPCHLERGTSRKGTSEPRQQKPQAQTANARKVRG